MLLWMSIIAVLTIGLMISLYNNFPSSVILSFSYLILLTALAILYRVFRKIREGKLEELENKLNSLKEENVRLKEKIEEKNEE